MNLIKKTVFALVVFVALAFIATSSVKAQERDFSVNLDTSYTVTANGDTKVSHHFKIKNLNPTVFIKQYGLKLSSSEITNVVTRDNSGEEISTEVVSTNNLTNIGITFPDQVVGQNKARDFTITYNNPDVAVISGQVLEVSIPHQANPDEFDQHKVSIFTPLAFGLPTRARPQSFNTRLSSDSQDILTTFENLRGEGASLLFGNTQIFDMDLRYSLENPTNTTNITQVALPPDTPYQRVNYKTLDPIPNEIHKDIDGNWIATYRLEPNSATIVNAHLLIKITLDPDNSIPFAQPDKNLLNSQKYWPTDHKNITELTSGFSSLKDSYDYVVDSLEYDYNNLDNEVERLGALGALENPSGSLCQEFSDLFITFARAQGVPSRRITGYSYTQNEILRPLSFVEDILHAWPEYFDNEKGSWIPVDPTWENTSGGVDYFNQFDLNHIVFAINGQSSQLPYPAGSYKLEGEEGAKDIEVSFSNQFLSVSPDLEFKIVDNNLLNWPVPGSTKLYIFNRTGQAHYNLSLNFTPENNETRLTLPSDYKINYLLPFEKKEVKINAYADGFFWPKQENINISYNDKTANITTTVVPIAFKRFENPIFTLSVGAGFVTLALISGSILVLISKWRSTLRRKS
ncbi:MAG: transglutaminase-like domain-containing protein [Candidatus Pacebacteria bacterium]|nr:transglutaminase-like domain-containing protein [Candidatus Paceibacterota bacterium]